MKKIIILVCIFFVMSNSVACAKKEENTISSQNILLKIKEDIAFENYGEENIKDQSVAERYGISPDDIQDGTVYYAKDKNKSDKIIIIKAKDKNMVEKIEMAMSAEIVGMADSWAKDNKESKKIENHIFKTKGLYVMLCVSEDAKDIVKKFDKILEK